MKQLPSVLGTQDFIVRMFGFLTIFSDHSLKSPPTKSPQQLTMSSTKSLLNNISPEGL